MQQEQSEQLELSIVVPLYNEAANVSPLLREINTVLMPLARSFEIILVNDGSTDDTWREILSAQAQAPQIVAVGLRGNQGQTAALAAGFDVCRGKIVISMDGDLQHDPRELPKFIAAIDEGYDLASGWRSQRLDPYWSRKLPSRIANKTMAWLSGIPLHDFGTTFKAYRRDIVQNVRLYGQFHRFIPVLAQRMKPKIIEIPIVNRPRRYGKSNYNIKRTFTVFFDLIRIKFLANYLTRPLQVFGSWGFGMSGAGACILFWLTMKKYFQGISIMETRAPLFLFSIFLMLSGIQFFTMGLLGEILVKLHHEMPGTKSYILDKVVRASQDKEKSE